MVKIQFGKELHHKCLANNVAANKASKSRAGTANIYTLKWD